MARRTNKPPTKAELHEIFVGNVHSLLTGLYERAMSHVPCDVTDDQLFDVLVREEDKALVRRSVELFHNHRHDHNPQIAPLIVPFLPNTPFRLLINFGTRMNWLQPSYLQGQLSSAPETTALALLFESYLIAASDIRRSWLMARNGWEALREICNNDLRMMRYLWPPLDALATQLSNLDLSAMPKPKELPAVPPDVRANLNEGAAFINSVFLMPPRKSSNYKYTNFLLDGEDK